MVHGMDTHPQRLGNLLGRQFRFLAERPQPDGEPAGISLRVGFLAGRRHDRHIG